MIKWNDGKQYTQTKNIGLYNATGMAVTPLITNNGMMDLSHLPKWVYFLVATTKGAKVSIKIVKI